MDVKGLEREKELYLKREPSTLGLGIENFNIAENVLEIPDYDLLPQSTHGRLQTGDDPLAIGAPQEEYLIEESPVEQWLKDPEIQEKFRMLGSLKDIQVTKAKMKATAKNYQSKEELSSYLQSQLDLGV